MRRGSLQNSDGLNQSISDTSVTVVLYHPFQFNKFISRERGGEGVGELR